ncbi:MAG: hypothetical protein COU90_00075 [Candidatus Ryanbacteria bacterium CG10_big_fil_rev_8_21_14_0_10_43_42]|uniref:DHHA1 domain-containing protein n=1 Tax=Candidatus Ryanbacteria bacterium CG10_big_fil_rev_8_21_14_0_10_43_42 TaxID=1974864 RepID=A0A2M8KYD0_9BACT|nr:MAG: hypothetical protein COU90_00075 [Candidatus Ryanbacteria bacterium CG10_big_fil_rev_8_21_14_0_10_43_42]
MKKQFKQKKSVHTERVILYHADCPDGFAAAWAAWKKFKTRALYIPVPPSNRELPAAARGKAVYTVDCSFPKDVIKDIKKDVASLTVIDHHITNKEAAELADEYAYDVLHSGAVLSWKYFHPKEKVPKLLQYIEDSDLWKFKLPRTKKIMASLQLYDAQFAVWDKLVRDVEAGEEKKYLDEGSILLRQMDRRIGRMAASAEDVNFEGYVCKMVNTNIYVSELGHTLVKHGSPVAIMWSRREHKIIVSLRSDGSVNVAELAERYGGGGHKSAAGFSFEVKDFLTFKKGRRKKNSPKV